MNFFDGIRLYWQVILFVGFVIFNASWAYSKIKEVEERTKKLEERNDGISKVLLDIQLSIASIKTFLEKKL